MAIIWTGKIQRLPLNDGTAEQILQMAFVSILNKIPAM
jgi:hypothetical protein